MNKKTSPSIMQLFDEYLVNIISSQRNISGLDALRLFLNSKTHEMLENDDLKMWHFSPLAILDMWEVEMQTGDPRNSSYIGG